MYLNKNKKFSNKPFAVTEQELSIRNILLHEGIPFIEQKEFRLNARRFIVDFFIAHSFLLECSSTTMYKYDIALRQKAIQLEVKCFLLKKHFFYPIWVLFESKRPIGDRLLNTLYLSMPSVDKILTSRYQLLEVLQGIFKSCYFNQLLPNLIGPNKLLNSSNGINKEKSNPNDPRKSSSSNNGYLINQNSSSSTYQLLNSATEHQGLIPNFSQCVNKNIHFCFTPNNIPPDFSQKVKL